MKIFEKIDDLQAFIQEQKKNGKSIGFVPTMGALHEGHLSLIRQAKQGCEIVVCSIFVNPTQFNNEDDLSKYPKTITQDREKLVSAGTEVLFLPSVAEIYPDSLEDTVDYDLGDLDGAMEGAYRPGHFKGVVQVMKRLLDIVQPHQLVMGQKDFQQFSIIQRLLTITDSEAELLMGVTVREEDGLAMSSRNLRLTTEERKQAVILSQTLKTVQEKCRTKEQDVAEVEQWAKAQINKAGLQVDYFEIVDTKTLQKVDSWEDAEQLVACTAAYLGEVRLIDNMLLPMRKDALTVNNVKETCLYVTNLYQTKEFYHDKLGLAFITLVENRHVFFRAGSSVLLCFVAETTAKDHHLPSHAASGQQHFAFEVAKNQYTAWKNKLIAEDIAIEQEVTWRDSVKSFYFRDPDQHLVEIVMEGLWDY